MRGFTLIELMIVVTIVGILAAIGYPSYQNYVLRAQRSEAVAMLMDLQAKQERYYFSNNRYTNDVADLGHSGTSENGKFEVDATDGIQLSVGNRAYVMIATRTASARTDANCTGFLVEHTGIKGVVVGTVPSSYYYDGGTTNVDVEKVAKCWGTGR